jgi:hypothetical protein
MRRSQRLRELFLCQPHVEAILREEGISWELGAWVRAEVTPAVSGGYARRWTWLPA